MALSMKKSERTSKKKSSICVMPKCPISKLITYNNLVSKIATLILGMCFQLRIILRKLLKMIWSVGVFEN